MSCADFLLALSWYLSCSSLFLHVLIHNSDSGKSWHLCSFLKVSWNKKQLCCLFRRRVWLYRVCVSAEKARFFLVFARDRCVLCDACIGVRSGCCQCSMSSTTSSSPSSAPFFPSFSTSCSLSSSYSRSSRSAKQGQGASCDGDIVTSHCPEYKVLIGQNFWEMSFVEYFFPAHAPMLRQKLLYLKFVAMQLMRSLGIYSHLSGPGYQDMKSDHNQVKCQSWGSFQ